ncbi:MAG: cobalt-zinc-cadmium resistance protein [Leptothrix sp. (in: Bacteria)]|nr:cobalt-zinc-cadmium resistance protein [Leptothrix sp. (in: b-proteobacteria)]
MFVFLLLVVPFQLTWGSAAPYCAHETGVPAKKHFGHHEHKHQAGGEVVSPTDDAADDDDSGAFHAECASCHLGCPAFMPVATPAVQALPDGNTVVHPEPRYDSHIPTGPQRPDRAHPAPAARLGGGVVMALFAD